MNKNTLILLLVIFLLPVASISAQEIKYVGRVVEAVSLQPIPHAFIKLYGTDVTTSTNAKGYFEVTTDTTLHKVILISHIGFKTADIRLPTEARLKAVLERQSILLGTFDLRNTTFLPEDLVNDETIPGSPAVFPGELNYFLSSKLAGLNTNENIKDVNATVSFMVNQAGRAVLDTITGTFTNTLDSFVRSTLAEMPEWKPAVQNGIPVVQFFSFRVLSSLPGVALREVVREFVGNMTYTIQARRMGIEGLTLTTLELDSVGNIIKIAALTKIGAGLEGAVAAALEKIPRTMLQDLIAETSAKSFVFPVHFELEEKLRDGSRGLKSNPWKADAFVIPTITLVAVKMRFSNNEVLREVKRSEEQTTNLQDALRNPSDVKSLHIPAKNLHAFPTGILMMKALTTLNLDQNKIQNLPENIDMLKGLTDLYLYGNKITVLPTNFANLKELKVLGLSSNGIKTFPAELLQLSSLEILDLSHNQLESLPPDIGKMTKLRIIYLHGNMIADLPEGFFDLKLETIFVAGNPIKPEVKKKLNRKFPARTIVY